MHTCTSYTLHGDDSSVEAQRSAGLDLARLDFFPLFTPIVIYFICGVELQRCRTQIRTHTHTHSLSHTHTRTHTHARTHTWEYANSCLMMVTMMPRIDSACFGTDEAQTALLITFSARKMNSATEEVVKCNLFGVFERK